MHWLWQRRLVPGASLRRLAHPEGHWHQGRARQFGIGTPGLARNCRCLCPCPARGPHLTKGLGHWRWQFHDAGLENHPTGLGHSMQPLPRHMIPRLLWHRFWSPRRHFPRDPWPGTPLRSHHLELERHHDQNDAQHHFGVPEPASLREEPEEPEHRQGHRQPQAELLEHAGSGIEVQCSPGLGLGRARAGHKIQSLCVLPTARPRIQGARGIGYTSSSRVPYTTPYWSTSRYAPLNCAPSATAWTDRSGGMCGRVTAGGPKRPAGWGPSPTWIGRGLGARPA